MENFDAPAQDANYPGDVLMSRGKSVRLLASIPERYTPDFMDRLDRRTVLGRAVFDRHEAVTTDLGGAEALSTVTRSLVRQFIWFDVFIEGMACRAASGEEVDIGAWTQLTNTWLGLARLLGLERRARPAESLRSLMADPEPAGAESGDQAWAEAAAAAEESSARVPVDDAAA
jgi:hypothetical protein